MDEIQQLKHRLAMVLDDMRFIRKHIEEHGLTEIFEKPTPACEYASTHIHNIEIACDLNSNESLSWKPFVYSENNKSTADVILELHEKHNLWIYAYCGGNNKFHWGIANSQSGVIIKNSYKKDAMTLFEGYESPTKAHEKAIEYALNNLINKS